MPARHRAQTPYYEAVLENDGSTDDTLQRLRDAYDLYEVPPAVMRRLRTERVKAYYRSRTWSKLLVVDTQNGGKADSLNVAWCSSPSSSRSATGTSPSTTA